jgi:hypothetical protein
MLVMAAINAVSYFFRSASWGSLIGRPIPYRESLGFPFTVWEAGNAYGGWYADYGMLTLNTLIALGVGSVLGLWAALQTPKLNRQIEAILSRIEPREHRPIQFSLRGLLVATGIAALIATLVRHWAAREETLIAIYALGPTVLVAIAMLPRHLRWQTRVTILVPAAYTLIAAAIAVGIALEMEFDKVLMGIFLCWTPQSALAAAGLITGIFIWQSLQNPGATPAQTCSAVMPTDREDFPRP